MRLLFVCTANRSRSPAAAALWRRELERRGVPADDAATGAESAGVMAREGEPPVSAMVWTAALHGVSLAGHRSRALDAVSVERADLVLTMTREQADQVGLSHTGVGDRLFLLGELATLLRMQFTVPLDPAPSVPPTGSDPAAGSDRETGSGAPAGGSQAAATSTLVAPDRLTETLATARARRVLRGLADDDIAEPGDDRDGTAATLERIAADLRTIADALIGPPGA